MADLDTWMDDATPDEVTVGVVFNRRLFREFQDLTRAYDEARVDGMLDQTVEVRNLAERLVEVKEAIDEDRRAHTFVFATIDYDRWAKLVEQHQPTAKQKADNPYLDYNPLTFPQAAIAACAIEPSGVTVEGAEQLRKKLPRREFDRLFEAVWQSNVGGSQLPKSVSGTVDRLATELRSTTPVSEDFPSPSSEDGQ